MNQPMVFPLTNVVVSNIPVNKMDRLKRNIWYGGRILRVQAKSVITFYEIKCMVTINTFVPPMIFLHYLITTPSFKRNFGQEEGKNK